MCDTIFVNIYISISKEIKYDFPYSSDAKYGAIGGTFRYLLICHGAYVHAGSNLILLIFGVICMYI
jgi:hypothetical protein